MRIYKDLVLDVLADYGYDEIAKVEEVYDETDNIKAVSMFFPNDSEYNRMDVIYSIDGIVVDIIKKCYARKSMSDYYDAPRVEFSDKGVKIIFVCEDFNRLEMEVK